MSLKEHIQMMTLLASMMGDPGRPSVRFVNDETYSDLISEYKLIQQKKSGLSRSQRDSVVARVERLVKQGKIILPNSKESVHRGYLTKRDNDNFSNSNTNSSGRLYGYRLAGEPRKVEVVERYLRILGE